MYFLHYCQSAKSFISGIFIVRLSVYIFFFELLVMKSQEVVMRFFLIGLWTLFFLNQFFEFTNFWQILFNILGLGMLVVHLIEYCVIKNKITHLNAHSMYHFYMVIVFGAVYWWPLVKDQSLTKN